MNHNDKQIQPHEVRYRATFRQPILREDQIQVRIPCPIEVEVFAKSKNKWAAREVTLRNVFEQTNGLDSARDAMLSIARCFEEKLEDWRALDPAGNRVEVDAYGKPVTTVTSQ